MILVSDGARLITTADRLIHVWDATRGQELQVLVGHTDSIETLATSADGTRICTSSKDKTMKIWELSSAVTELFTFNRGEVPIKKIAFSADGSSIFSLPENSLSIQTWNAVDGTKLFEISNDSETTSREGSTGGNSLPTIPGICDRALTLHSLSRDGKFKDFQVSLNGTRLYTTNGNKIQAWDAQNGDRFFEIDLESQRIELSFNGAYLLVSDSRSKKVWVLNSANGETFFCLDAGEAHLVNFSNDDEKAVTVNGAIATVWEITFVSRVLMRTTGFDSAKEFVSSLEVSSDDKFVAAKYFFASGESIYEVESGTKQDPNQILFVPAPQQFSEYKQEEANRSLAFPALAKVDVGFTLDPPLTGSIRRQGNFFFDHKQKFFWMWSLNSDEVEYVTDKEMGLLDLPFDRSF